MESADENSADFVESMENSDGSSVDISFDLFDSEESSKEEISMHIPEENE